MPSSNKPLAIAVVGIAVVSSLGVTLFDNAQSVPVERASGSRSDGIITGGNHSEAQPHSANVQSAGDYHIEAQMSRSGELELYIYGQNERQLRPIQTRGLEGAMEAKAMPSGEDGVPIVLQPRPYPTDPEGTASRFAGRFERRADQEDVGLTLTLSLENQMYRVSWRPENLQPGMAAPPGDGMPRAIGSDTAKRLFLTPGGLYAEADIAANGRMTSVQKYGMQMSSHNPHPKRGDRICPITDTVANPKFAWVVGGKKYLFCCPPCVEEFVKRAKETPKTVKAPEDYVRL